MQKLRIFAASPSDMATERAKVGTAAAMLKPLADALGIVLDVADWRAVVPDMGRPEQVILEQLKPTEWDVFVGILWHRFGTPPGASDEQTQREYLSGTEEEFKTAYRLWKEHGKPRVMMYRCARPIPPDALDPDQFKRVQEFFAQFEAVGGEHPGLHQTFNTIEEFERLFLPNLQHLLLEYGEQIRGVPIEPQVVQTLAPKIPNNLPRRAPFFGRRKEMRVVMRALSPEDRTWGVLIDGIGGIGKTSLAVEAAHRCQESGCFEGFVFVSAKQHALTPGRISEVPPAARTLDEFLNETARVLDQPGIPKLAADVKRRALFDALRERPTLLVYDNLETLSKDEQEALADFLRDLPTGCKAIITSRRRGGEGSVWLRLEKLDWEAARQLIAAEAERNADLAAKLRRAGKARWQELYDATGGSPLALSHTLGLMRVRATLSFDAALDMLRGNRDPDLQRFIFLEARREFTTNDEAALRTLSFFAPSVAFEAWADVAQLSRTELATTADRLSALSLVDVPPGEDRFALHPLTRKFVADELLSDKELTHDTGMRFARYWLTYAQRHGGQSYSHQTFNLIETEWPNIDAAAQWLWEESEMLDGKVGNARAARMLADLVFSLCHASGPLFYVGRWDEILWLIGRAYDCMSDLGDWLSAGWLAYSATWTLYSRGRSGELTNWAECCAEAMWRTGTERERAVGMHARAWDAQRQNAYAISAQLFGEALAIYRKLNVDQYVAVGLGALGDLELEHKNYESAERCFRAALALKEYIGSDEVLASTYGYMGLLELARKRWDEARGWLEKGLSLAREIGRQDMISETQAGLARVYEAEGRPDLALPLAQEALAIEERFRPRSLPETRELVGRLLKKIDAR